MEKKSAQYSFVLPTIPSLLWDPELLQRQPRLIESRCLPHPSHSLLLVWLCPSLFVPVHSHHVIQSESGCAIHTWRAPHWNVPRLQTRNIWLKLSTSLARSFIHQVKIHSVPRYYFLKYILVKNPHVDISRLPIPKNFPINTMLQLFVYVMF